MPIYEFNCDKCKHTFDELVAVGAVAPCPKCGSAKVHRAVSAPACHSATGVQAQGYAPPAMGRTGGCGSGSCGHKH